MSKETGALVPPQEENEAQLELWQEMVSVEREPTSHRLMRVRYINIPSSV